MILFPIYMTILVAAVTVNRLSQVNIGIDLLWKLLKQKNISLLKKKYV